MNDFAARYEALCKRQPGCRAMFASEAMPDA